ncbi:MAG: flagellar hook-associated protein FlgK [Ideonella sp.]|nr:flagellar hook-associated protein FlgK [Ideonella sp.]
MSASALFSLGTRAMTASYAALQTTGNNIANASTRGYSRQQVALETAGGQFSGNGFFGSGVNVTTVSRSHNEFLTREVALTRSLAEADGSRLSQLQLLEQVFGTGAAGLGYLSGELLNAFADVASRPGDTAARQVVLARAQDVASAFQAAGDQIERLQTGVAQDLRTSIATVNALAQTVADLNRQIAAAKASGHEPNDLLDQRDSAVAEISGYLQVTTLEADDGSLSLFIGGGQNLVLGSIASKLAPVTDPFDPARVRLGMSNGGGPVRALPDGLVSAGSIAGLLRFQDVDLRDARNAIGQLAAAVGGAINAQQHLGLDLSTATGRPGADLFVIGAPRVLNASTNAGTASISLVTSDAGQLLASEYELRFDGANYTLNRLGSSDAAQTFSPAALAAGVDVDGMTLRLASGTASAGDRFLLQPVAAAASGMARALDDPRGIAAASPVTATLAGANTGTLSIASLQVRATMAAPDNVVVRFDEDASTGEPTYQISTDGGSSFGAAQALVAGEAITLTDSGGKVLWEMSIAGTPAVGDEIHVDPTLLPGANNGNALAMVAQRDAAVVGGETITDAWAGALAEIGVRVQSAQGAAELSASVASEAEARNTAASGVNLDEEAARLIQYQQSYQAAAQMLQVAQAVFDSLLQATNA